MSRPYHCPKCGEEALQMYQKGDPRAHNVCEQQTAEDGTTHVWALHRACRESVSDRELAGVLAMVDPHWVHPPDESS